MKIPIADVVADFVENAEEYADGKQVTIADNPDFGVEITIEGVLQYGSLYADLTVWGDQTVYDSKTCYTERELRDTLEDFYESYISPNVIDTIGFIGQSDLDELPPDPEDDDDNDEEIDAMLREEEIDRAVLEFVTSIYGCDPIADSPEYDLVFNDLKEKLLAVLAEVDEDIYRPSVGAPYPYINN